MLKPCLLLKSKKEMIKKILKSFWKGLVYEPFNYPFRKIIPNALYGKKSTLIQNLRFVIGFIPFIRNFMYIIDVSERIIEDPFVISEVTRLSKESKILDFGCYSSLLPLQLASLGYKVTGVDINYYDYLHPNFNFLNIDLLDNKFKNNSFDLIYAVSALEHVGAGWYENEKNGVTDSQIVKEFKRILKSKGKLLVTVPFGKKAKMLTDSRMYDEKKLRILFSDFRIISKNYYAKKNNTTWLPTDENNLKSFNVACWVMEK